MEIIMKISKRKKTDIVTLSAVLNIDKKEKNTVYIYILKFMLVLMGVYGSVFCFISGIKISFNYTAVILPLLFCTVMCLIIFLKKKAMIICTALVIWIYLNLIFILKNRLINGLIYIANSYMSATSYNYENTHFSALMNPATVQFDTALLIIAVEFLICFIVCLGTFYKTSIVIAFIGTFPLLELVLFYGLVPNYAAFSALIAYWAGIICAEITELYCVDKSKYLSANKKASVQGASVLALIVLVSFFSAFLLTKLSGYERPEKIDITRQDIQDYFEDFSFEKLSNDIKSVFKPQKSSGAINHGNLKNNDNIRFDNKTVLEVSLLKTDETVYLKGFTGVVYKNNRWNELSDDSKNQFDEISGHYSADSFNPSLFSSFFWEKQYWTNAKNVNIQYFSIKNVNANKHYIYIPYNINQSSVSGFESYYDLYYTGDYKNNEYDVYSYMPDNFMSTDKILSLSNFQKDNNPSVAELAYREYVYETYLQLPDEFTAAGEVFDDDFETELSQLRQNNEAYEADLFVINHVKKWLSENCLYSLKTEALKPGEDFVTKFLAETRKGSCSHFSSSAVLLFRYCGIPTRYAEGYVIKDKDFPEGAVNGETYSVSVTDKRGHAWVEIYLNGYGWYPVEVTSGYGNIRTTKPTDSLTSESETEPETSASVTTTTSKASDSQTSFETSISESVSETEILPTPEKSEEKEINFYFLLIVLSASIIAFVLIRRLVIEYVNSSKINNSDSNKAILNIYQYLKKLMLFCGISQGSMTYKEFSDYLSDKEIFGNDYAHNILNLSLRAYYGNSEIEKNELLEARKQIYTLSKEVYSSLDLKHKFKYLFVECLKIH